MLYVSLMCARFGRARSPLDGYRRFKLGIFLGDGSPLAGLGVSPYGVRLGWQKEEVLPQQSASIPTGVALSSTGSCSLGWGKTLATVAVLSSVKTMSPCGNFYEGKLCSMFWEHKISGQQTAGYTSDRWGARSWSP